MMYSGKGGIRLKQNIDELVGKMTLEEKACICSGADYWRTKAIDRLDIPSIAVSDGPHGLRKTSEGDNTGIAKGVEATCFPTASALSSSWDREFVEEIGRALGEECQALGVDILLGPGINMKRSPLCGRNFEYYSEDPYLAGEIGAAFVNGVQSQGVGTCVKHFACNNAEFERLTMSSEVDERTLREIYLSAFERVVKRAKPWSVMSAYNRINSVYASENKYLLMDILRDEWGFDGIVISDWGAVSDRVLGTQAGLELEMPGPNPYNDKKVIAAVKNGELDEKALDERVKSILKIIFKAIGNRKKGESMRLEEHHDIARRAAEECMVLLKNEKDMLPIKKENLSSIAVIGRTAVSPRYQGAGSSKVTPSKLDIPFEEIEKAAGEDIKVFYCDGYPEDDSIDEEKINDAVLAARKADIVLVFAGLPEWMESEGADRKDIYIPDNQIRLINEISRVNRNIAVILSNGSAVSMLPWINDVKAILETWLTGQGSGAAIANILFGSVNPCGKLSETFPKRICDNPSYLSFPGENGKAFYEEGIFIGYRYYDKKDIEPLFPFGYGLSYTSFEYSDIKINRSRITDSDTLSVSVNVKNTGKRAGKEIVQLYVRDEESRIIRPEKELKGFSKVFLNPGESKRVIFNLSSRDFSYYDTLRKTWVVESGYFDIMVGSSSRETHLYKKVYMESRQKTRIDLTKYSTLREWLDDDIGRDIIKEFFTGEFYEIINPESEYYEMKLSVPLYKVVFLSEGLISEEMIDDMVMKAQSK